MEDKLKTYILGLVIGAFLLVLAGAIIQVALKQNQRLKKIAKALAVEVMKRKVKAEDLALGEDVDTGAEITIKVDITKEVAMVNRLVYGSNLAAHTEFEVDVMEFAKGLGITAFRFPGGVSPGYHWQSGKYDFDQRNQNAPLSKIDNLIEFCKRSNAGLVIQVNTESGTAQEAAEWVEYMNKKAGFPVEYWEIGNEVYGDWDRGYVSAEEYARIIKEYAQAMKALDPEIKIGMAWAPTRRGDFNEAVMKRAGEYVDFASCHWYPNHINPTHRYEDRIHPTPKEVMANALEIPAVVNNVREIAAKYAPGKKGRMEVGFLEWDGAWDGPNSDFAPFSRGIAQWSLVNAIFHADVFGQLIKNKVSLANQYLLQDINYGLIRGWDKDAGWGGSPWNRESVRPKAFALKLFAQHFGDVMVESLVENSPYYIKQGDWWPDSYAGKVPYISCYAGKFSGRKTLSLVLINKHEKNDYKIRVDLGALRPKEQARAFILNGPGVMADNEVNPMSVGIKEFKAQNLESEFVCTIPAHSVSLFKIDYED